MTDLENNDDTQQATEDPLENVDNPITPPSNQEIDDDSEETTSEIESSDNDIKFQTRILTDKSNDVYGAEIVLFNEYTDLDRILITSESSFNEYVNTLSAIREVYTPYSQKDIENYNAILSYYLSEDKSKVIEEYNNALANMSHLQKLGDLESILYNNGDFTESTKKDYNVGDVNISDDKVLINATHLDGYNSGDFSKTSHTHSNYLGTEHENVVGVDGRLGHLKLVDNLTTTSVNGGEVLSAKQGNKLKTQIDELNSQFRWSGINSPKGASSYIKYRVNEDLRLVVCNYHRSDYTGLKNTTGTIDLHKPGTIDSKYAPSTRVVTPLYRGDVTLFYNSDGSVKLHTLTKIKSINIHAQVMWHY